MDPQLIRAAGNFEKNTIARHRLGFFRCVVITATYRCPHWIPDSDALVKAIRSALKPVILRHPALCCSIVGEDGLNPYYRRLSQIDLRTVLSVDRSRRSLEEVLSQRHSSSFEDIATTPPWRLTIISGPESWSDEPSQEGREVEVAFSYHHAVGDGLSGYAFHRSLFNELNRLDQETPAVEESSNVVQIPASVDLFPPMEKAIRFSVSWLFLLSQIWTDLSSRFSTAVTAQAWTGEPRTLPSKEAYISRVRLVSIPSDKVQSILAACRQFGFTLTGVLHGIVTVSLARLLPEARRFDAGTPYSLRRRTGTSFDEIVNQISTFDVTYPNEMVKNIHRTPDNAAENIQQVWLLAQQYQRACETEMKNFPTDNIIGMLDYVRDWHSYLRAQLGKKRSQTFEVSNLGVFRSRLDADAGETDASTTDWKVTRVIFTQSGMVGGAAIGINPASVADGPLTVSLTWQEGVVSDVLIDGMARRMEVLLNELASSA